MSQPQYHWLQKLLLSSGICTLLLGCQPSGIPQLELGAEHFASEEGVPLTQAVRTGVMRQPVQEMEMGRLLTAEEQQWIGRYAALIPCTDPFSACDQGQLTFILNFSEDGYVYRNRLLTGKINVELNQSGRFKVRKDLWSLSEDGRYLVTHAAEGIDIFWKIIDKNTLQFDLEAIQQNNLPKQVDAFFTQHAQPSQAYALKRM